MDAVTGALERRAELRATLLLDALPGVGPAAVRRLIDAFGSAPAALRAVRSGAARAGPRAGRAAVDPALVARVDRGMARVEELGIRAILHGEPGYPGRLDRLADPPSVLFVHGRRDLLIREGVAVVGSRRATPRARALARALGRAVSGAGVPVVSGLALGVDGEAHRGALEGIGSTVAVLGSGPDRAYPASHRGLFAEVCSSGAIVSEFLPGTPALRHHFPRRNRILAALARTVVVVEARARSGALITVEHALDLGLDVWAVPGPIDEPTCAGSNALLADGARALVSIDRFVGEALGFVPPGKAPQSVGDPEEGRVLEALEGCVSLDAVADASGLPAPRALALLSRLELAGRVERAPGLRFRRTG